MRPLRFTLAAAVALTATTPAIASAAPTPRPGCAIVSDKSGDTSANVGAPASLPQSDSGLDITGVDLASNARWIGARVRMFTLDNPPPNTGGDLYEVSMKVGGGTLTLGAGRYANATGIDGDANFAYAGFQRGTVAPRDVPARAVQLKVEPATRAISVFVDRQALRDIGATSIAGSAVDITAWSGRQYGDEFTVQYDDATGTKTYKLGAASCLRLPG